MTNWTYREKYKFIHKVENDNDIPLKIRFELIKDWKVKLRRQNKPIDFSNCNHVVFDCNSDGSSWIVKDIFDYVFTKEQIEEYLESEWIRINSPYDCTGYVFTMSIYVFPLPKANKTIVYHWKGLDI